MQPFMPPLRGSYFLFIPYPGFRPLRDSTPGLPYTTRASAGSDIRRAKPAKLTNSHFNKLFFFEFLEVPYFGNRTSYFKKIPCGGYPRQGI